MICWRFIVKPQMSSVVEEILGVLRQPLALHLLIFVLQVHQRQRRAQHGAAAPLCVPELLKGLHKVT